MPSRRSAALSALWKGAGTAERLLVLLVLSVVAGLLSVGLVLPVVGAVGYAARSATDTFEELPSDFKISAPPSSTTMYANDGKTPIARFFYQDRVVVPISAISPWMQKAQVAIEDSRFYQHGGADLRGMLRAGLNNASGGGTQGASTLTQQYVKLALVYAANERGDAQAAAAAQDKSISRKLQELRYAVTLETKFTKAQILEKYLNIAYYGAGAYGVETAANRYFGKHAKDLTISQAALLAGLVQRPNATDPLRFPAAAQARRDVVLQRMVNNGYLTQAQADRAKKVSVKKDLHPVEPKQDCETAAQDFRWFCDYAKSYFLQDKSFGATLSQRKNKLYGGGLKIVTTLDPTMEKAAQKGVDDWVHPTDEAAGVVTMVEPGTGAVRAIAISRRFGDNKKKKETKVNLALDSSLSGSIGTQAGSTFKAFVAAYALTQGRGFGYNIYSPAQLKSVRPMKTCDGYASGYGGRYKPPGNENPSENGVYDMRRAMAQSINTYFIQLSEDVGLCGPATLAGKMGLQQANNMQPLQQVQSFTLGTNNVAPLDMAAAYATFASRGMFCPAYPFERVLDRRGDKLPLVKQPCTRVLDENVADAVNYLLRGVVTGGSGARAALGDRAVAGKTGTTQGRQQAWFIGYTPNMVGTVTFWDPDPPKGGYRLAGKTIGGRYYSTVLGANLPAPTWHDSVGAAIEAAHLPVESFQAPEGKFFSGGSYAPSFRASNGYVPKSSVNTGGTYGGGTYSRGTAGRTGSTTGTPSGGNSGSNGNGGKSGGTTGNGGSNKSGGGNGGGGKSGGNSKGNSKGGGKGGGNG